MHLDFDVHDDGVGFDPIKTPRGSGLQNMFDRTDAVSGTMRLVSEPGSGTRLAGSIPLTVAVAS